MSDPWQDEAEGEDGRGEELTGPAGGNPLATEELDAEEDDDSDLSGDDDLDGDAA